MDSFVAGMLDPRWGQLALIVWWSFIGVISFLFSEISRNAYRKYVRKEDLGINNTPWRCTT